MPLRAVRLSVAAPLDRPTCHIPTDRVHEFFNDWLPTDSPIVASWVCHFITSGTAFRRVDRNGRTQLYLHRVKLQHNRATVERWCCSARERERMRA